MTNACSTYSPWECSPSYEQKYAEDRDHVARLLAEWGCQRNTDWPQRAQVSDLSLVHITPSWANIFVRIGKAGITHNVDRAQLVQAFPDISFPNQGFFDTYFVEHLYGNVQFGKLPTLSAYVMLTTDVLHAKLGCNHQGASIISDEYSVKVWECPRCEARWGQDRGD